MPEGVVFVGKKATMNYVLAIITQFQQGQKEVEVKARGKAINRLVGAVEVLRRRFMPDVKIAKIEIGSEEIEKDGKKSVVPLMSVKLTK